MEILKKCIVTLVAVLMTVINASTMYIINKCKWFSSDVTKTLFLSVFAAGMLNGITLGSLSTAVAWLGIHAPPQAILNQMYFWGATTHLVNNNSLTILSCLKLFAVVSPFRFQQTMTVTKVRVITVGIWILCAIINLPVFFRSLMMYSFKTVTVGMIRGKGFSLVFYPLSMCISLAVTAISTISLAAIAIRQKMKERQVVASQGQMELRFRVVLRSIQAAKSVIILCITRLILHFPFFVLASFNSMESSEGFYSKWASFGAPVADAICCVMLSQNLRKQLFYQLGCLKSAPQQTVQSIQVRPRSRI